MLDRHLNLGVCDPALNNAVYHSIVTAWIVSISSVHFCCVLQNKGCFHGSELAMVFDFTLGLWTPQEKALASAFVEYVLHYCLCVISEVRSVIEPPLMCDQ